MEEQWRPSGWPLAPPSCGDGSIQAIAKNTHPRARQCLCVHGYAGIVGNVNSARAGVDSTGYAPREHTPVPSGSTSTAHRTFPSLLPASTEMRRLKHFTRGYNKIYKITKTEMGSPCNENGEYKNYQKQITDWTPYKTRPLGRPRLRWMDQVEEDLKRMKIVGRGRRPRIGRSGIELLNRPRHTQGCRINRRRRRRRRRLPLSNRNNQNVFLGLNFRKNRLKNLFFLYYYYN